ncbi:MAG TPA: DUF721 domain-containing protein [Gemmatimonadales bacterium]|nr:DUF721 domain-containing protein [Gemmatimonadales bacterium]
MARRRRPYPIGVTTAAPSPIGEVVEHWIGRSGLRKRLDLADVVERWPTLVGPQIGAVTQALAVTPDNTLMVRVTTSAWATELGLMAPSILTRINGSRKGRVRGIRWLVGPLDQR